MANQLLVIQLGSKTETQQLEDKPDKMDFMNLPNHVR